MEKGDAGQFIFSFQKLKEWEVFFCQEVTIGV